MTATSLSNRSRAQGDSIRWAVRELQGKAPGLARLPLAAYPLILGLAVLWGSSTSEPGRGPETGENLLLVVVSTVLLPVVLGLRAGTLRRRRLRRYGEVLPPERASLAAFRKRAAVVLGGGLLGLWFLLAGLGLGFKLSLDISYIVSMTLLYGWVIWAPWRFEGAMLPPCLFWLSMVGWKVQFKPNRQAATLFLLLGLVLAVRGAWAEGRLRKLLPEIRDDGSEDHEATELVALDR